VESSPVPSSLSASNSVPPADELGQLNETEITEDVDLLNNAANQPNEQPKKDNSKAWGVFTSTFVTIFLAEIGDKTQLTTLLMSAQSHSPWIVFAGAGSALVLTSLLGVLLGQWLATRIDPKTLEKSAGIILLIISALLSWEIFQ
jgi:putative Ca2+/H+ antiporter (TMEM165/GDT1 family)